MTLGLALALVLAQRPPPTFDALGGRFDLSLPVSTSIGAWLPATPVQPFFAGIERAPGESTSSPLTTSLAIGPSVRIDQSMAPLGTVTFGLSSGLWFHPLRLAPGASFIQVRPVTGHLAFGDSTGPLRAEVALGAVVNFTALKPNSVAFGSGGFAARVGVGFAFNWVHTFFGIDFSLAGGFARLGLVAEAGPAVRRVGQGGVAPAPSSQPFIERRAEPQPVPLDGPALVRAPPEGAAVVGVRVRAVEPTPQVERVSMPVWQTPDLGDAGAPVVAVLFTDAECRPHCLTSYRALEELVGRRPGKVRVYVRHAALSFHAFGKLAAAAMVATAHQGKTWRLLGELLRAEGLAEPAIAAALQAADVTTVVSAQEDVIARLDEDAAMVRAYAITAVPTVFINGRRVEGAGLDALLRVVDEELAMEAR